MKNLMMVLALTLIALPSFAGKVETVKETVKKACSKDLDDKAALDAVKKAFLSCTPGSEVEIDGCKIKCLKENAGAVVGG